MFLWLLLWWLRCWWCYFRWLLLFVVMLMLLLLGLLAVFLNAVHGLKYLRPLEKAAMTFQEKQLLTIADSSLFFCFSSGQLFLLLLLLLLLLLVCGLCCCYGLLLLLLLPLSTVCFLTVFADDVGYASADCDLGEGVLVGVRLSDDEAVGDVAEVRHGQAYLCKT